MNNYLICESCNSIVDDSCAYCVHCNSANLKKLGIEEPTWDSVGIEELKARVKRLEENVTKLNQIVFEEK